MTDIDRYVSNILATYARATDADVENGSSWYPRVQTMAQELSPADPWRAAGVFAIFSARTPWNRNVELARNLFATGIASGHMFTELAQRIYNGEPVMEVLKGDKTRAFTGAIATGGKWHIATIDGHAYDIADGHVWGKNRPGIGKRVYADMAAAYSDAATVTATDICEIQAITWVTHRRILGFDWRG